MNIKEMQMLEFEIEACRKNMEYCKDQMSKGEDNGFYQQELRQMEERLAMLSDARLAWEYY